MTSWKVMVLFIATLSAGTVVGLEADRNQPITIQADDAMLDERQGTSIYRGDVTIDQGTLHISADEVEVISDGDKIIQIIATGKADTGSLAHYEQKPEEKEDLVKADAHKITWFVQEERLHLVGDARLVQAQDTFSGQLLYYNVNEGIVSLSGGAQKDRVIMTINPKN
ncbi:MAG: lipopolysaccharide transport periplasmic protein LptA [Pseudomonadales bacterium]